MTNISSPSDVLASCQPSSIEIEAIVVRADGTRQDLGVVSYWHKNPLRRACWKARHVLARALRPGQR